MNPAGLRIGGVANSTASSQVFAQTGAGFIASGVTELTRVAIQGGKINWVSIASSTAQAFTSAALTSSIAQQRAAQGSTVPVAKSPATEPAAFFADSAPEVKALMYSNATAAGGMQYKDGVSPYPLPPDQGGLSASHVKPASDGRLVMYNPEDVKVGDVVANNARALNNANAANKGDWRFTEYANNAFTRDRLLRADAIFTKAVDSMLQNKDIANSPKMQYHFDNQVLRDSDKNPSVSMMEYNSLQAHKNSFDQRLGQSTLEAGLMVGGIGAANRVLSFVNRAAPILKDVRMVTAINAGLEVSGQAYETNFFTEGSYRLDKTLVTVGTSWLSMGAAARFLPATSSLGVQYIGNAGISGATGLANTAYSNATGLSGDEKSLTDSFVLSAGFGTAGKYFGQKYSTDLQTTFTKNFADLAGGRRAAGISGISSFFEPSGISFIPYDQLNKSSRSK